MSDDGYYDSEEWREERCRVLEKWDGMCEHCDCCESPHVHHCLGLDHDVYAVLCPESHADHHGNDEIVDYQKKYPTCKRCGIKCYWKEINGRWKIVDYNKDYHICKDMMNEVKELNKAFKKGIDKTNRKKQRDLF